MSDRLHELREIVGDEMETFSYDYLAMNPRPEEGNVACAIPQDGMTQTD